jgi:hypothetical protein
LQISTAWIIAITAGIAVLLMGGAITAVLLSSGKQVEKETASNDETPIRSLVEAYYKAPYHDRYRYVHDGDNLSTEMASFYKDMPPQPALAPGSVTKVTFLRPKHAVVEITVLTKQSEQRLRFYVRAHAGKWLMDWPATVGLNKLPLKTLKATRPQGVVVLRARAEISDYYNYQFRDSRETHYSIRLRDLRSFDPVHGYAPMNSDFGKRLYQMLQDGKEHDLTGSVRWTSESTIVEVVGLISDSWFID